MVPDGNRPHAEPQEILRRAAFVILVFIGFTASHRDAAAETESQRPQPYL